MTARPGVRAALPSRTVSAPTAEHPSVAASPTNGPARAVSDGEPSPLAVAEPRRIVTGRPRDPANRYTSKYIDLPNEPLFPFGHGLSYTRFALRNLRAAPAEMRADGAVAVTVEVANEGARAGEETVLLFIRDPVASVARPVLELRGVRKAALAPGARTVLRFALTAADLAFPGPDMRPRLEAGRIELFVGPSADPARLLGTSIRVLPR